MTPKEIQILLATKHRDACLRSALSHEEKDKGGFSEEQNKAWLDYDEANALLSKLLASKS